MEKVQHFLMKVQQFQYWNKGAVSQSDTLGLIFADVVLVILLTVEHTLKKAHRMFLKV
jgi:hypothetical protein